MHTDYDFLITDREPIVYIEHAKVMCKDGSLVAFKKDGTRKVIPAESTMLLMLGAGTSISQAAAIFSAHSNLYLCFARGGSYVHSIWQGGRWQDPKKIVRQVLLHNNEAERLRIAKKILFLKLVKHKVNYEEIKKIDNLSKISQVLSFEGVQAKKTYDNLAKLNNINNFRRDKETKEGVNSIVTLLSNALYSYCTAIIIQFGFHPSVGFIHGKTRRGGLAFDMADIFKYDLCLKPAFEIKNNNNSKELIMDFSNKLKIENFRIIKEMIYFLRFINNEINDIEVDKILNENNNI